MWKAKGSGSEFDEVAAQVLPADKAWAVAPFHAGGKKVVIVGGGVNDALRQPLSFQAC